MIGSFNVKICNNDIYLIRGRQVVWVKLSLHVLIFCTYRKKAGSRPRLEPQLGYFI